LQRQGELKAPIDYSRYVYTRAEAVGASLTADYYPSRGTSV
jgi:hypothetical protein